MYFTISSRFIPKHRYICTLDNFRASDLGYYSTYHRLITPKCDYIISSLCPSFTINEKVRDIQTKLSSPIRNNKRQNTSLHEGFTIILLIGGDIAQNPGPVKYPCGQCTKPVRKNQRGIECDDCNYWFHVKCISMPINEYNELSKSTDYWFCKRCFLQTFSDSFFNDMPNENNISNAPYE